MSFFKKKIDFDSHPKLLGKTEEEVIDLMLAAARGEAKDAETNPFFSESRTSSICREIAIWISEPEEKIDVSSEEWVSVERLVRRDLQMTPMRVHPIAASAPTLGYLYHAFFDELAENLSYSWAAIYEFAAREVPFYRLTNDGYARMPRTDPTICFLSHMGQHLIRTRDYCFPSWARDIFLRGEHIKAYRLFLGNEHKEEDRPALVRAMLTHIGMPIENDTSVSSESSQRALWEIAIQCKQHFWSDAARELNPNPKSVEIVDWLVSNYGLSGRQANAIDIVLRPRNGS